MRQSGQGLTMLIKTVSGTSGGVGYLKFIRESGIPNQDTRPYQNRHD